MCAMTTCLIVCCQICGCDMLCYAGLVMKRVLMKQSWMWMVKKRSAIDRTKIHVTHFYLKVCNIKPVSM